MAILVLLGGLLAAALSWAVLGIAVLDGLTGPAVSRDAQQALAVVALMVGLLSAALANVMVGLAGYLLVRPRHPMGGRAAGPPIDRPPLGPRGPSFAGRAFLALVLTLSFYLIAGTFAVLLLTVSIVGLIHGTVDRFNLYALAGGLAIAWSVLPRPRRFAPPGPRVELAANPHLAEHLRDVASRVREPLPSEVYVTLEMNAGVAQRGGWFSGPGRRYMVLGLPLMQLLSVSEFRAVIAHEFGHYAGGDTALGPWVYRARLSIARTVRYTAGVSWILWLPFWAYAHVFLRVTQAVSRRQEYAADALAAQTVGAPPMAAALRKLEWGGTALGVYWQGLVVPVVSAGCLPPLAAGFHDFVERDGASARRPAPAAPDPYDSHPPTADRLAALGAPPSGGEAAEEPPATALLSDVPALERAALAGLLRPGAVLRPVAWEQVGPDVLLPQWRERVRRNQAVLSGAWLGNLVEWSQAAAGIGGALPRPPKTTLTAAAAREMGAGLLAMALAVALAGQGWSLEAMPGSSIACRRGSDSLAPFDTVEQMADGRVDAGTWQRWRDARGIVDAQLAAG